MPWQNSCITTTINKAIIPCQNGTNIGLPGIGTPGITGVITGGASGLINKVKKPFTTMYAIISMPMYPTAIPTYAMYLIAFGYLSAILSINLRPSFVRYNAMNFDWNSNFFLLI